MVVRQTGQVPPSAATLFVQLSQKRGTNANPSHGGATRQTRQLSVSVSAASVSAVVVAVEVDVVVAVSCVASSLLLSLSSARP